MANKAATKTTEDLIKNIIEQHKLTLLDAEYAYQVTFCETKYCHRYVNFEIDSDLKSDFDKLLS